ncbi:MAG: GntR family transcriptional regulator [Rhodospirillales bacterium]|nr:GntR family transcriptional regulator [Rhodospirillales bacterium]
MQTSHVTPGDGPLFAQVQALMIRRMVDGQWRPGDCLPSEFALAAEFSVSQGTVRKALDALAQEKLVVRHQGRGTFVSAHSPQRELFRFFHLVGKNDIQQPPRTSQLIAFNSRRGSRQETQRLGLAAGQRIINIRRLRSMGGNPVIIENISLPEALFAGLGKRQEVPNELYQFYEQSYGVTIYKAVEHLTACAASADEAGYLSIATGAPLLEVDRLAVTLDGTPVEWRVSRCDTRAHSYLSEII